MFCDQPAKKSVVHNVFLLCSQKHWYLQCFVRLWSKKYCYLEHFLRFCIVPAKDVRTKINLIYSIFGACRKAKKSSKNCVKTTLFSDFRYSQNGGWRDYALGDAYERPGFQRIFGVFQGPQGRRLRAHFTIIELYI